jgi:hypothetical protein
MNIHVVVAKYKEDTEWCINLNYPYTIISKCQYLPEENPNKGFEVSSYLEYIINNYYELKEYIIFVHGHQNAYHHKENMDETINKMVFCKKYRNINTDPIYNDLRDEEIFKVTVDWIILHEKPILDCILSQNIPFEKLASKGNAQFYVSKDLIYRYSRDTYMKLYEYIMNHKYNSYYTSRIFEYLWHYLFTGKEVENK